ncbi:L-histidine N(alpha)-methyltransferase [Nostoc sp. TCL26-01]|uniref:L-histidine N(alpha)-methyltransferase n=1 Tax=Nostoc sp. TCL26-01 TaxID=2576904 RepID=UPI0015BCC6E2|nr:L-histidine N(alpha)-methyltransferase [Nostoc sp. TCL26-01]QLE54067.1 hypothetical protein FD725_00100 [Nostoc sp. TCL26-01]
MSQKFDSKSLFKSDSSITISRVAKPIPKFYALFSPAEILEIVNSLATKREMPVKYSYKGRDGKIWDDFYLKYIALKWYRNINTEIELLKKNFEYIKQYIQAGQKVNVIDVGAGNSYPVKEFIAQLDKVGKINKYFALDISDKLLEVSRKNFHKWFSNIEFISSSIDIENNVIPKWILNNQGNSQTDETVNIILHLGVTIGNHQNRIAALKNFRDGMSQNDLLVLTNELGENAKWDGIPRGGCKYHAEQIYKWVKEMLDIQAADCELIRKYDANIDSVVANIKFRRSYTINFNLMNINESIDIAAGEEITLWRHHKYQISELIEELAQARLQLVHYNTNQYSSHIMAICQVAD